MDASVKNLTITGSAAIMKGDPTKPRRSPGSGSAATSASGSGVSRKKRVVQEDNEDEEPVPETNKRVGFSASGVQPVLAQKPAASLAAALAAPTQTVAPVTSSVPMTSSTAVTSSTAAASPMTSSVTSSVPKITLLPKPHINPGTGAQKVILNPPKSQRVKLNPKIPGPSTGSGSGSNHAKVNHTRRARRIIVPNLSARFTRAKKLRDETESSPIDTIRNYLIQKGVIQSKSRAPEKMLRSMYNDFSLLKDRQAL